MGEVVAFPKLLLREGCHPEAFLTIGDETVPGRHSGGKHGTVPDAADLRVVVTYDD
jgi:hypothetical protein